MKEGALLVRSINIDLSLQHLKNSKAVIIAGGCATEGSCKVLVLSLFDVFESVCIDADSSERL